MNDNENYNHKYYAKKLSSNNHESVSQEQKMIQRNEEFILRFIFGFISREKIVLNGRYNCYFLFSTKINYH